VWTNFLRGNLVKLALHCTLALLLLLLSISPAFADNPPPPNSPANVKMVEDAKEEALRSGDIAWMLVSSALVMLMVPGLALFYGGMVRRKNVLATMMQSMVALSLVGVFWISIGYCLAFGASQGGWIGWSPDKLLFLKGVAPDEYLANTHIPIYVHVMFQGMFAIITPALISGAVAERIRFGPYCLFILLWVVLIYCPLAHWVWAMNWWDGTPDAGKKLVGWLGRLPADGGLGAIDFAGGTVVHIAAGLSGLAAILVLRKRIGYPEYVTQPNSMVFTVLGAGLLWFGWFGFNGGSATGSNANASSAFAATQAAAAAAGLSWLAAEWLHRGKPTGLGLASGIVAGLVAVTPASGYVYIWGGLIIGLLAGVVCYLSVCLKPFFKYDDSLDAFGVHGVGGFFGALLTGFFCAKKVNESVPIDGWFISGQLGQIVAQFKAAAISAVFAFVGTFILVKLVDLLFGFATSAEAESSGLDLTEHGEVGIDLGPELELSPAAASEPRAAVRPPNGQKRFAILFDGADMEKIMHAWSQMCQTGAAPPSPEFQAVYPHLTTVQGNRFRFRSGDPNTVRENLLKIFRPVLGSGSLRVQILEY
jgi:ammonium transporter